MSAPVGIDLGTTNSVLAVCDDRGDAVVVPNAEGEATTPSAVAFDKQRGTLVGREALQLQSFGMCPGALLFKRSMGDDVTLLEHGGVAYTPPRLSALVLSKLADDACATLGYRPTQGVITVPAYFANAEREATLEAARLAGLECLQLINEPTAAAIAYRVDDRDGEAERRVLVYDLGGGTFDVTVLKTGKHATVLDSRGDPRLGGADWDRALAQELMARATDDFGSTVQSDPQFVATILHEAELLKKNLTRLQKARVMLRYQDRVSEQYITQQEFAVLGQALLLRSLHLTQEVLDSLSLRPSQIDAVLLVGGSTRMPMVSQALTELFGRPPLKTLNPDEAVAQGAALKARALARPSDMISVPASSSSADIAAIADNTNHGLGMVAIDSSGTRYINRVLIPRATRLPASGSQFFTHRFQAGRADGLEIFVTQGDVTDPLTVDYLGRYCISSLPGVPMGQRLRMEIAFGYDFSGVVSVRARAAPDKGAAANGEWITMTREPVPYDVPERFGRPLPRVESKPLSVILFFDVSGSMSGSPIQEARKAATAFVAGMNLGPTRVGIGVVSDKSRVLLRPSADADDIAAAIDRIEVDCDGVGLGNSAHPFDEIKSTLAGQRDVRVAVVFADGVWSDQDVAIRAAQKCREVGIEIAAIGFGSADERFLNDISSSRDLKIMTSEGQLVETFGSIAQVINERAALSS